MAVDVTWKINIQAVTEGLERRIELISDSLKRAAERMRTTFKSIDPAHMTRALTVFNAQVRRMSRLLSVFLKQDFSQIDFRPLEVRLKRTIETAVRLGIKTAIPGVVKDLSTSLTLAVKSVGRAKVPTEGFEEGGRVVSLSRRQQSEGNVVMRSILGTLMGRTVTATLVSELFPFIGASYIFAQAKRFFMDGLQMWRDAAKELVITHRMLSNIGFGRLSSDIENFGQAMELFTGVDAEKISRLTAQAMTFTRDFTDATRLVTMALNVEAAKLADAEAFIDMIGRADTMEKVTQLKKMLATIGINVSNINDAQSALKKLGETTNSMATATYEADNGLAALGTRLQNLGKELGRIATEGGGGEGGGGWWANMFTSVTSYLASAINLGIGAVSSMAENAVNQIANMPQNLKDLYDLAKVNIKYYLTSDKEERKRLLQLNSAIQRDIALRTAWDNNVKYSNMFADAAIKLAETGYNSYLEAYGKLPYDTRDAILKAIGSTERQRKLTEKEKELRRVLLTQQDIDKEWLIKHYGDTGIMQTLRGQAEPPSKIGQSQQPLTVNVTVTGPRFFGGIDVGITQGAHVY